MKLLVLQSSHILVLEAMRALLPRLGAFERELPRPPTSATLWASSFTLSGALNLFKPKT